MRVGVLDVVEGFEWWVENAVAFSNREGDADAGLDLGPVSSTRKIPDAQTV